MSRPLRVAQYCLTGSLGGLELAALQWARDFKTKGHESILIIKKGSPLERQGQEQSIQSLSLEVEFGYFRPAASLKIRQLIIEQDISAILVHNLRELWILYPALLGLGSKRPKVIGFAHMFLSRVNKKDFAHRQIYGVLDHLIVMTEAQKRGLQQCLPLVEEKYQLIPNGIDTHRFTPGPMKPNLNDRPLVIGFVGRMDYRKGVYEILEVARQLKNENMRFVMVGDDTLNEESTKAKLEVLIKESGLEHRVELRPFTKNIHLEFQQFDIFVMPSYEESFGLVLVEAMATGLPCISTRAGGPPEILNFGKAGLLIEPKSVDQLREAILDLANNSEKRAQLGAAALERAKHVYCKDEVYKKVLQLL